MQFSIDVTNRCFLDDKGRTISQEAENLKDYQQRYLPPEVLKILKDNHLSDETRAYAVFKWMYNFAIDILTGYKDCYAPFGGRWSNDQRHHLNLLSTRGEEILDALNDFKNRLEFCSTIANIEKLWKKSLF